MTGLDRYMELLELELDKAHKDVRRWLRVYAFWGVLTLLFAGLLLIFASGEKHIVVQWILSIALCFTVMMSFIRPWMLMRRVSILSRRIRVANRVWR